MGAYKKLTLQEKERAVAEVNAGLISMKTIAKSYSIGYSSLKLLVVKSREGARPVSSLGPTHSNVNG